MSQVRLSDLDAAAKDVQMAQKASMVAEVLATPGQTDTPEEAAKAALYSKQAIESCVAALQRLENMGAQIVGITGMPAPTIPLHLLDTPATRALMDALEAATLAAEAVDRERGNVHPDGTPSGFAETIGGMALGLRTEVFGPVDLRQE